VSEVEAAKAAKAKAGALIDERRFREAIEPAADACRLAPNWAAAWWSYGVALKHGRRWADCLKACDRAIELDPDDCDGCHWNAGIAATALGNWSRARAAWTAYGIEVPPGEGPLDMRLGTAGVRVSLDDQPEVVYGKRLDPCRVRLQSVPLPESKHRFGDIVLHDGEPRGKRRSGDREITVFDELLLLEPSSYGTWTVEATCRDVEERDALVALFDDVDGAIEDWTESLEVICAQCSLGEPHDHHEQKDESWRIDRRLGLALRDERDLGKLRQLGLWWRRGIRDVTRAI
jgi:tetratricopeptide (TPR) repeat protein